MTSLLRVTRFALNNFFRDIWLSSVTIIIFILAITSVGVLSGVKVITDQAITVLKSKVDVLVTFVPAASEQTVLELKSKIEQLPETASVVFISAAENLENFRQLHSQDSSIVEGTNVLEDNPFGPALKIQARSLEEYPKIAKVFEDENYARSIESGSGALASNQLAVQKLSDFTRSLSRFSFALTLIFAVIATLVVVNTMRIAMYAHREEIGIMKLVGASNWFVRGPFVIESVCIGLLAAALASGMLLTGISLLSGWFDTLFKGYDIHVATYLTQHFFEIFWLPLLGAVVISVTSAGIAVGRYLKV